jgi:Tol biopolymer transport system component
MRFHRLSRVVPLALAGALAVATGGCRDVHAPPLAPDPVDASLSALIVSNPAEFAVVANPAVTPGVVYASLPPGSVPDGESVLIRTRGTGAQTASPMMDGGFDPVPVAATAGDTLEIRITLVGTDEVRTFVSIVPERRPPVVVRTDPPPRRRDVPLNVMLLVMFSEPIDAATVSSGSVQLSVGGIPVSGAVGFGDSAHLSVTFVPAAALAPGAEYTLRVAPGIADLDGDSLGAPVTTTFTTVPTFTAGTFVRVSPPTATGTSRLVFDGDSVSLQSQWPEFGFFEHRGSYTVTNGGIALSFGVVTCCVGEVWTATVTPRGDSLFVAHVHAPSMPPIEDGVYVRTQAPTAPGDAAGRVAFRGTVDGVASIYVANPDGSGVTRLTDGIEPAWSWDGGRIAYATDPGPFAIHTMAVGGSNPVALGEGRAPDWSPDGTQIVFSLDTAIAVMNTDGSNRRVLVTLTSPGMPAGVTELRRPTWSPDGGRIAFDSWGGPGTTVLGSIQTHIMDADGSNLRLLSQDGWSKYNAAWSPDGTRIAALSYDVVPPGSGGGYLPALATYDVGSGQRQVVYGTLGGWLTEGPEYTPDGRYLAFGQQSGYGVPAYLNLVLDLGTGAVYPLLPGVTVAYDLAWSRTLVSASPAEVYERTTPDTFGFHSRYLFYEPDQFELQYVTEQSGSFAYLGRYARADSVITFRFDANAGAWGATGTLRGDSLFVAYNLDMQLSDFVDGVYVRTAPFGFSASARSPIPAGSP